MGKVKKMTREEALLLLKRYLSNQNLFKHCLAVEAIMRALAKRFAMDEDAFGLAGLLHDIDYELTLDKPEEHSLVGGRILKEAGLAEEIVEAVVAHNARHGVGRQSLMAQGLYAADPASGFIVAAALIRPEKSLAAVDVDFLLNRFREKSFAKGASREAMQSCQEFGLSLGEFLQLALGACQSISKELGL